ncbi:MULTISPECIES: aminotransferase [unclassified Pseudomonas]|uniref:aminotransferase n=1 Tax=unclassified Pseudomonas TaxID=196821 RepID=UPI000BD38C7A|nr:MULTISPECIES: aminotransferase [unclassified Pseudomonas]PVZ10353.1 4-aminobutyrate aminotransferase-like enzyme [Pseudomonas sp. URIL14HWK12:I12]PVZ21779.1 4-aminobutyrate aminotransferase-like enzyme [Pseudomonas sp. URIL14HWK12:I10]PVZ31138.1 4-aminobutyrate aminotransferase-like enzyme [Pseudomonas sp. URIL14HWK12:I11]SNZ17845.1 hydroxylysine kinase [Pseudomonas sp. URIL14HWK12:I9]
MLIETLSRRASLPPPDLDADGALALLEAHYGLTGRLSPLGSQQDRNFFVEAGDEQFVLKACRDDYSLMELQAQHQAMAHLAEHGLPVPRVLKALNAESIIHVEGAFVRVLSYLGGQPLTDRGWFGDVLNMRMGQMAAKVSVALAGFEHPGLERTLQWDPRHAWAVTEHQLPSLADPELRARATACAEQAWARVQSLADALPQQAVHLDLTDDNSVWALDAQREWALQGMIDFGDLCRTWRVAELAVTCSALLHHSEGDPFAILPAVRAWHAECPLTLEEAQALWPIILGRTVVVLVGGAHQLALDPGNTYVQANAAAEREMFEVAQALPLALMEAAILEACGFELAPAPACPGQLLAQPMASAVRCVDLGVLSPHFEAGNWEQPGIEAVLLAEHAPASSRYGEYRLARTLVDCPQAPETFALHVDLMLAEPAPLLAPFSGHWREHPEGGAQLCGEQLTLRLWGLGPILEGAVACGDTLGTLSGPARVQLIRAGLASAPLFCTASRAAAWRQLCPSPAGLLGWDCDAPAFEDAHALLARRDASFARSQKHYYAAPPRIERGWRNHLIDLQGRSYLDMLNNVATLGHGHPRMAQVAARQWSLLNTNSRFHYAAIAEFSERLLKLAPAGMDRVFMVNSGTEANDLAIRLAWAFSGGRDMLSVLEAYHGWSVATDAISTSIADNPQALSTRPAWVHPVMAPNTYRGAYRGAGSTADYLRSVDERLAAIDQSGRPLAGFICEPVYGNAGGIALPPGYLEAVYDKVRARGGVCIADEVQVGYGRLGEYFWGFEEQGVVPDIITMAKGMGNGQPLGVVITRREIAEALEAQGYFFSSAGGSPVSCQVGMAVLDVMEEEGLWDNARETGRYFKARLEALVERFPLVGAAHGSGFYLGLELVRDRETLAPATEETARLCDRLRDLGIFMQPTGDYLNILKIKPPMNTTRQSVDFFVDSVARVLSEGL